jgi:hypothetical protein
MAIRHTPSYNWYQIVSGPDFTQGDVFRACPIPVPTPDEAFFESTRREGEQPQAQVQVRTATVIVLTQACDIEQNKVDSIVLCPMFTLADAGQQRAELGSAGGKNKLRNGNYFSLHLLNCDPDIGLDYGVVDFRILYSLPTDFVRLVAEKGGERPRLLPPL